MPRPAPIWFVALAFVALAVVRRSAPGEARVACTAAGVEVAARAPAVGEPPWTRLARCDDGGPPLRGPARRLFGLQLDASRAGPRALESLPGIGPGRASALVALRAERPLCAARDLEHAPGIGPHTRRRIAPHLYFGADLRCGEAAATASDAVAPSREALGGRREPPKIP